MRSQSLVNGSNILHAERHDLKTKNTLVYDEHSLLPIVMMHQNLILAGKGNHEAHHFVTCGRIDKVVDVRMREGIFGAGLMQIYEVNTHAILHIFLLDDDYVSHSVRVLYLDHRPDLDQFSNIFIDNFIPLHYKLPSFLFHWNMVLVWIYLQSIGDDQRVNFCHVGV